jgi:hypothetical protein
MMGIEVAGLYFVQGDNMSVVYNNSNPTSSLKKKSNFTSYHFVREAIAVVIVVELKNVRVLTQL